MSRGPFDGVMVVDVTRVLAGPFCTMLLAELGARVIKVENPDGGDDSRHFEPFFQDTSAYFSSLNRGKESIALNLKDEQDCDIFLSLIRRADVLVENYRPGTLDRLGLGYHRLQQENGRLIYAAISGFGQTGPWKHKPAYDLIVQALSGLMSITGLPSGPPTKTGTSIGDITGGLFAAIGISAALYHRQSTGRGMLVDVSMLDGQIAILESAVMRYAATGQIPGPIGNRHPSIAPFELYQTSDQPIVIAAGNDTLFSRLCEVLGRERWANDPRFATNRDRVQNADALKTELESVLRSRSCSEWLSLLESAGIPCSPVHNVAQACEHPQVQARNMIVRAGDLRIAGNPIKFSAFDDPPTRKPAPKLDEDGPRIRAELSGDGV
ncbi:MAG: CoA:oxalate CoA-transferase [Gemmatales bacterium]|nr:MAG: CoA:oxalate CoA-transferase [Gemmatales bacterium]